MNLSRFDFPLPDSFIAQTPASRRDASRLLVVDRSTREINHHHFRDIGRFLPQDPILFRNDARVLPARLYGHRPTGGSVECLLLHPAGDPREWWCLVRPGKKLSPGSRFGKDGDFEAEVTEVGESGQRRVRFCLERDASVADLANRIGTMPLPPYIHRETEDARASVDRDRYQTVYAKPEKQVAAAAPTAGLHFSPEIIRELESSGCTFADITLHIGLGTFQPIQVERIEDHPMHSEIYEIPAKTRKRLLQPEGRARVSVGTTCVRAIEDFFEKHIENETPPSGDFQSETAIFIYPPRSFRGVDALLTNFHLPRSTLLCLVSAFLTPGSTEGIDWLMEIYAEAIEKRYRFFSYGDAMLIL